jgi:hypothetical protein
MNVNAKLLVLVVSTAGEYQAQMKCWIQNRELVKNVVDIYFVEYSTEISSPQLQGFTLKIPGTESPEGFVSKTVQSFRFFLIDGHPYTHILRTNMSSLWFFNKYLEYIDTLPLTGVYSGVNGVFENFYFVSGAGITFTPDVCTLIAKASSTDFPFHIEDVDLANYLLKFNINAQDHLTQRHEILRTEDADFFLNQIRTEIPYHFRIKFLDDRSREGEVMNKLFSLYSSPIIKRNEKLESEFGKEKL